MLREDTGAQGSVFLDILVFPVAILAAQPVLEVQIRVGTSRTGFTDSSAAAKTEPWALVLGRKYGR